ncbi:hypothetical protein [Clostridium botulinum]|uniref:hypothetical protein n=1 Tax=Clostridium botulinum TaxID=1491 RepID=UPI002246DBC8|nr:hypothetical protein [Clostridium botulinum]
MLQILNSESELGYKDTSDAIKVHVDEDDKGVGEIPTPGGKRLIIIPVLVRANFVLCNYFIEPIYKARTREQVLL